MKKEISIILFWGALWGLFEATVGYVLHAMEIKIGFLIWFPAAYFFMSQVYRQTGKSPSVFWTAAIAATIKLIDFLLPVRMDMVLNPFASILLEGLVMFAVYKAIEKQSISLLRYDWFKALSASLSWRILYLIYLLPLPEFIVKISPLRGIQPFLKFLVFDGIMGSLVLFTGLVVAKALNKYQVRKEKASGSRARTLSSGIWNQITLHPIYSMVLFAFAVYIQWLT